MVQHGSLDVQQVNHAGNNRHHALVHRRGRPGRPAALGTAGHDKPVHLHIAPLGTGAEGGHRIHGTYRRFGHRQPGRPFRVAGPQELVPGISNEGILLSAFGFAGKHQRLVGYHLQFRHHRFGSPSDPDHVAIGRCGCFAVIGAAANEQQRLRMDYRVRPDDVQPVFPDGAVHLVGREPGLGGHFQNIGREILAPDGVHDTVAVVRVGRGDVFVQRRLLVLDGLGCGGGPGRRVLFAP